MSLWPLDGLRARRRPGTDAIFAAASPQGFASRVRQTLLQPRRRHVLSRCLDVAGIAFAIGLFLLVVDFTSFITGLTRQPPSEVRAADGIVALTGGSERISEAFDLLADGMGKRLLITGVNLATSGNALSAEAGTGDTTLLKCCVDLDRNALNTVGNAIEAARWVHERKFHSLIVVTSNYHMPRSLLELRRVLPETELLAYPVVNPNLHLEQWWQDGGSLRLVVSEYLKFLGARLQLRLEPATLGAAKSRLP